MPYCPNCHEEYDEGMSACANCGADLVDAPFFSTDGESLDRYESVFVGPLSSAFELKSLIEDDGIAVILQGLDESQESLDLADEAGLVKIMVPIEAADAAASVIESAGEFKAKKPAGEVPFPEEGLLAGDLGEDFDGEEDFPVPEGAVPGAPADPPEPAQDGAASPTRSGGKKAPAGPAKGRKKAPPQTPRSSGRKKAAKKKGKQAARKPGRRR